MTLASQWRFGVVLTLFNMFREKHAKGKGGKEEGGGKEARKNRGRKEEEEKKNRATKKEAPFS